MIVANKEAYKLSKQTGCPISEGFAGSNPVSSTI